MAGRSAAEGSLEQEDRRKQEVMLDLTQLTLDLVGMLEPTPFADGSNALISLTRKDWLGAGLNAISILPYLGDLAKFGKGPRYIKSVRNAIELAARDTNFAASIRPVLEQALRALDKVPGDLISRGGHLREQIASFLRGKPGTPGNVARILQKLSGVRKAVFIQAMKLPLLKHPRLLKKRPGPVSEDSLIAELMNKGFVHVKKGNHSAKKLKEAGPGHRQSLRKRRPDEDSEIYMRRIVAEDGRQYFEAVRIDRKFGGGTTRPFGKNRDGIMPSPDVILGVRSPGELQQSEQQFRRVHNILGATSTKVGIAQGGGRTL